MNDRRHRLVEASERDIAREIRAHLEGAPASTAPEIARSIKARVATVIGALNADARFARVSPPPGRSRRGKFWANADSKNAAQAEGTAGNGASGDVSEPPWSATGARVRDGRTPQRGIEPWVPAEYRSEPYRDDEPEAR